MVPPDLAAARVRGQLWTGEQVLPGELLAGAFVFVRQGPRQPDLARACSKILSVQLLDLLGLSLKPGNEGTRQ